MTDDQATPDRRGEDPKFSEITKRIDGLVVQHTVLMAAVESNTVITKKIETSTAGLVEAWDAISGGLKVLNFLGKVAKWVTYIAGMLTAVYTAWHFRDSGPPL